MPRVGGDTGLVREVLERDYVLEHLALVRDYVASADVAGDAVASERTRRGEADGRLALTEDDRAKLVDELDRAQAEAASASAENGTRFPSLGINFHPHLFVTRNPLINLLQSRLEECIHSHRAKPPAAAETRKYGQMEPCSPSWIASWVSEKWSHLTHNKHGFPDRRVEVPLGKKARLLVVGDWATGLPPALDVRNQMVKELDKGKADGFEMHVVHLGDVYFSGWERECDDRLLTPWPVPPGEKEVKSWALCGNHDMYSGGDGYFDTTLGNRRFAAQEGASFFALTNDDWQVLGLDTAYADADLYGPEAGWITERIDQATTETILLSHHQLFSKHDPYCPTAIRDELAPVLERRAAFAWFWGHEHRCIVYKENLDPYVRFARCIGHGGVPAYLGAGLPQEDVEFELLEPIEHGGEEWLRMGFAVLEFTPGQLRVRYIDETGKQNFDETLTP